MTTLKVGEHTEFISKQGTRYWVLNLNGRYYVEKSGSYTTVKATKEIKANIKLA